LKITLARITLKLGLIARDTEKTLMIEVPKQHWGHKRKFSIIKGAQTKLGV